MSVATFTLQRSFCSVRYFANPSATFGRAESICFFDRRIMNIGCGYTPYRSINILVMDASLSSSMEYTFV